MRPSQALARDVRVTDVEIQVALVDGRRISIPLVWFPSLMRATHEERERWCLLGAGEGIHWPDVDEDISVAELLVGPTPPNVGSA